MKRTMVAASRPNLYLHCDEAESHVRSIGDDVMSHDS